MRTFISQTLENKIVPLEYLKNSKLFVYYFKTMTGKLYVKENYNLKVLKNGIEIHFFKYGVSTGFYHYSFDTIEQLYKEYNCEFDDNFKQLFLF